MWRKLGQVCRKLKFPARALEVEPNYGRAWHLMGELGGGIVSGQRWSAEQCLNKAVELMPDSEQ